MSVSPKLQLMRASSSAGKSSIGASRFPEEKGVSLTSDEVTFTRANFRKANVVFFKSDSERSEKLRSLHPVDWKGWKICSSDGARRCHRYGPRVVWSVPGGHILSFDVEFLLNWKRCVSWQEVKSEFKR